MSEQKPSSLSLVGGGSWGGVVVTGGGYDVACLGKMCFGALEGDAHVRGNSLVGCRR